MGLVIMLVGTIPTIRERCGARKINYEIRPSLRSESCSVLVSGFKISMYSNIITSPFEEIHPISTQLHTFNTSLLLLLLVVPHGRRPRIVLHSQLILNERIVPRSAFLKSSLMILELRAVFPTWKYINMRAWRGLSPETRTPVR